MSARAAAAHRSDVRREVPPGLSFHIYSDLAAVEAEWRRFERVADCTAFQTFDWLASWQRHVGEREASARSLPSAVSATATSLSSCRSASRRTVWRGGSAGSARNCATTTRRCSPATFRSASRLNAFSQPGTSCKRRCRCEPLLRYDWIEFEKMPQKIGAQLNPFTYLGVTPNRQRRASDPARRRLGKILRRQTLVGDAPPRPRQAPAYVAIRRHPLRDRLDAEDARHTLETLMEQKSRSLARKGIADIFAPPGHREFFLDLVSNPNTRHWCTSAALRSGRLRGGQFRHRFRRLLLPRARELRRRRSRALRAWRASPA